MRILLLCHNMSLVFLPWVYPHLPFFSSSHSCFYFITCSLTAYVHEGLHAPLLSFAFLFLCFSFLFILPFFLTFPTFFWLIILCDTLILLTIFFRSQIVKDPEKWGKLYHWRISILLPGHVVFHSVWKLEFLCFVVLIHVGVPGIPAPNLGIKVYYSDSFNIFLYSWSYYFWRDEQARRTE